MANPSNTCLCTSFSSMVSSESRPGSHTATDSSHPLLSYIRNHVIGRNQLFESPFGLRTTLYCDWTASGKCLSFIENYINCEVLPSYGNTHTTTTFTSSRTTLLRQQARNIFRKALNATKEDAVIFVGSGCTSAIHKLIHNLNLETAPIVIIGPFEHHSNTLPWRHLAARVTRAQTDNSGTVSIEALEQVLRDESKEAEELGCKLIVCMTAASNVTGILIDVDAFSSVIHRYGGLAFWDYATAAPYVKMDMNPTIEGLNKSLIYKDAIYFSMHKFVGGPQTPGVLVAKQVLFKAGETQPSGCGGGTVFFVRRETHRYLKDVEEREEGGTPAIIESIRAGLVMQLKESITSEVIMEREGKIVKQIWKCLADCPNIIVLGGKAAHRLPIISMIIRHQPTLARHELCKANRAAHPCLFLHHNFVAALFNDLFGIQARSGCACAGPYAMDLLGIDEALAKMYEATLSGCGLGVNRRTESSENTNREVIRPGFTRISMPYFISDEELDFVMEAIKFVATHGWIFLPLYRYNPCTGEWIHHNHQNNEIKQRSSLENITYSNDQMVWPSEKIDAENTPPADYEICLTEAHRLLCDTIKLVNDRNFETPSDDTDCLDDATEDLRWFLYPKEAMAEIRSEIQNMSVPNKNTSPWHPGSLTPCFCPDLQKMSSRLSNAPILVKSSLTRSSSAESKPIIGPPPTLKKRRSKSLLLLFHSIDVRLETRAKRPRRNSDPTHSDVQRQNATLTYDLEETNQNLKRDSSDADYVTARNDNNKNNQ